MARSSSSSGRWIPQPDGDSSARLRSNQPGWANMGEHRSHEMLYVPPVVIVARLAPAGWTWRGSAPRYLISGHRLLQAPGLGGAGRNRNQCGR